MLLPCVSMTSLNCRLLAATLLASTLATASAHAQTFPAPAPLTGDSVIARPSPLAGRGQVAGGVRFGSDDLDLGLGVRAGYTLPNKLYLGGTFDYFFGDEEENAFARASASLWMLASEVGYEFPVAPNLVLRPFGGLAFVKVNGEFCITGSCTSVSDDDLGLVLGGLLSYVSGSFFAGGDLRLLVVDDSALVFGGHAGIAF